MNKEKTLYKKEFKKRKKKLINFIKKDYCEYNGEFPFIYLNKILIDNYLEYYTKGHNVWQANDSLEPTIAELKEVQTLFQKLIDENYEDLAHDWLQEHYSFEKNYWDSDKNKEIYKNLILDAEEERCRDYIKAFKLIGKYCRGW